MSRHQRGFTQNTEPTDTAAVVRGRFYDQYNVSSPRAETEEVGSRFPIPSLAREYKQKDHFEKINIFFIRDYYQNT